MTKYKFSTEQKCSIWKAYGKRCFYCTEPVLYSDLEIDHILPESLIDNPNELDTIKSDYGLDSDFSINSYYNWVPSHHTCNWRKAQIILPKETVLFYLGIVKNKIGKIKEIEKRFIRDREKEDILISLGIQVEKGLLSMKEVISFLDRIAELRIDYSQEPIVMSFGLLIEDVMDSGLLPENVPTDYPRLCDWLEGELITNLKLILSCSFSYIEASSRDGESLTVRLAFWQLDINEIDKFSSPWWNILEFDYFPEIYGVSARKYYSKAKM